MEEQITTTSPVKGWVRPLLIMIPYLIIVSIFQAIGYWIVGLDPKDYLLPRTSMQNFVISLFTLIGTIIVITLFRRGVDNESFRSLGFYPKDLNKELITGLSLGALIITSGFGILILTNEIQWVGINLSSSDFMLGFLLFIAIALGEELLFRGYILNNLMLSMPRMVALLISAVLFSLMHIFNSDFTWFSFWDLTLGGLLLGISYIYTKSLWFPIAQHFSWNFFQGTIFGFNVSGNVTYSLFAQSRTTDNYWNGGKFGFEGSVLSIIFQLIAIIGIWWYYNRKSNSEIVREPVISITQ